MNIQPSIFFLLSIVALALTTSCANHRNCQRTVAGATIGAVTGAILDRDGGVGGAIAGGVIGGAIGAATEKRERNTPSPYYYPTPAPSHKYPGRNENMFPR